MTAAWTPGSHINGVLSNRPSVPFYHRSTFRRSQGSTSKWRRLIWNCLTNPDLSQTLERTASFQTEYVDIRVGDLNDMFGKKPPLPGVPTGAISSTNFRKSQDFFNLERCFCKAPWQAGIKSAIIELCSMMEPESWHPRCPVCLHIMLMVVKSGKDSMRWNHFENLLLP